jgi:hypothetical protein
MVYNSVEYMFLIFPAVSGSTEEGNQSFVHNWRCFIVFIGTVDYYLGSR